MRVVVTGADGYIGRVLCAELRRSGAEVIGIDSRLFAGCAYGADEPPAWTLIEKDVRDLRAEDLRGVFGVCHMAALSNDPLGALDAGLTREINFEGTLHVARVAKDAGVARFVFASSCSVYGRQPEGKSADETAAFAPQTEYARSKVESEAALARLASRDFSPTYLRQSTAYGWSERLRLDLVLNNFVAWALATGEVRLLSRGDQWRPLAHVRDLSAAFVAALNAPRDAVHDTALNVGDDGANYLIRDLADAAAKAVGASVRTDPGAEADTRSYRVSFARIRERLPAWKPQWNAVKGAVELKQQMTRKGFAASDLEDERFIRLRRIQRLRNEGRVDAHLRPIAGLVA